MKAIRPLATLALLAALTPVAHAADLVVTVEGFREAQGQLLLSLCDEAGWNSGEAVDQRMLTIDSLDARTLEFGDLEPGSYAIRLMHDANGNGKLDSNALGIPSEGYGYSSNPVVYGPASFAQAAFDVVDGDEPQQLTIQVR